MRGLLGTSTDCLTNLVKRQLSEQSLKFMAEFTKVNYKTARRWGHEQFPKGESLLRVMVFLSCLGYEVTDFVSLAPEVQKFNEMIAFDVIDVNISVQYLDYRNSGNLFSVLLRGNGLQPHRVHRLRRFIELKESLTQLEDRRETFTARARELGLINGSATTSGSGLVDSSSNEPEQPSRTPRLSPRKGGAVSRTATRVHRFEVEKQANVLVNLLTSVNLLMENLKESGEIEAVRVGVHSAVGCDQLKILIDDLTEILET
jgi:hypothetical protein